MNLLIPCNLNHLPPLCQAETRRLRARNPPWELESEGRLRAREVDFQRDGWDSSRRERCQGPGMTHVLPRILCQRVQLRRSSLL